MSDKFYGEVLFPGWAYKYLPGLVDDVRLEVLPDGKTLFYAEKEARNGTPWICDELDTLGIPYNRSSAEYYEYRGERKFCRFRDGGKIEDLVVTDGDELVEAKDILNMIQEGKSLEDVRAWCQKTLDQIQPLNPPIEEISEEDYLAWVEKYKAWVFQDRLKSLRDGRVRDVGDPYVFPDSQMDAGVVTIDGLSGLLVTRPVAKGRLVPGSSLDEAEKAFAYANALFFKLNGAYGPVGAFVPFRDGYSIADAVMLVTDRLEILTGNVEEPQRLLAS